MDISAIPAAPIVANTSKTSRGNLSLTDFYKLLAAEMQFSDPLSGGDSGGSSGGSNSSSYISELCTLTQVTAIQALTQVNNYSMATNMTGKTVSYDSVSTDALGKETTTSITGEVEAVDYSAEKPRLFVAGTDSTGATTGKWIDYTDVKKVYNSDVTPYSLAMSTVGKTVDYPSDSVLGTPVKGVVKQVKLTGETPLLYVQSTNNGTKTSTWISYGDILNVYADDPSNNTTP